ncbi:hypothetical protein BY996DRAFT_4574965 [Phakopsora pachyrhizi]|nr:hypothetical protein BY996DRAFT_4574965 [Phakopsora pachyrhizi]
MFLLSFSFNVTTEDGIRLSDPYPSRQIVIQEYSSSRFNNGNHPNDKSKRPGRKDGQVEVDGKGLDSGDQNPPDKLLIPVTLGVMSKCPDAQICEDVIDKVLPHVEGMVVVSLSYIGKLDPSSRYGVKCMHGESECKANIQQLCYKKKFPQLKDWWSFVQCQNYAGLGRLGDDILARSCSKLNRNDYDRDVRPCVEGELGEKLLRASIKRTKNLQIVKSCSILINHKLICVHDGSWKDCPIGHHSVDFVNYIKKEYHQINPSTNH